MVMSKASISIRATPAPRTTTYQGHSYAGLVMGQTYTIEIRNNTAHRVEAVVSVDGWRTSQAAVAAFELTPSEGSYAALTTGIGAIGLAIFEETRPLYRDTQSVYRGAPGIVTRGGSLESFGASAGTGFGAEVESRVRSTTFDRATTSAVEFHAIVYDNVDTLIDHGILPAVARAIPNPFPADTPAYCKAPNLRAQG